MAHVFVLRGDLLRFECDAWLCPTDRAMRIEPSWRVAPVPRPAGWGASVRAVVAAGSTASPLPVLTDVGGSSGRTTDWYCSGVRAFLDTAAESVHKPRHGRERPLLALPVIGTGEGGARDRRGEMTAAILQELLEWTGSNEADVVLVTHTERAHAAAQSVRRGFAREHGDRALWNLDSGLVSESMRLAGEIRRERLVLFLGAGIGSGAGLPSWDDLLDQLASEAGLGAQRKALHRLGPMDRAALIAGRLGEPVGVAVARRFAAAESESLSHALLAGLPVRESATTNYDLLFERAAIDAGRDLAVLPYQDARSGKSGWLLKLHGSVDHPDDIVLTRADYLSYGSERAALRGLVQALLITRHMLFVGFSLKDENFHQVVHDVRQAIRPRADRPTGEFGTALMLDADDLARELWRGDLRLTPVGTPRRLEIFLDHMLCHAIDNTPHLLDPTYDALLTEEERAQAASLSELGERVAMTDDPSWDPIRQFLEERGWSRPSTGQV